MPLQATSGAASYDGFGGGVAVVPTYIEDVFSTYLYTGNKPSTQTVTNGIDLSGKGGMVWTKNRASATFPGNVIFDTARGAGAALITNSTAAQDTSFTQSFSSTGFDLGGDNLTNQSGITYCSWTFREQPKFFDVVTYTGTGSARTVAHNLGSVPGSIIVKRTNAVSDWAVYHRSLANTEYLVLNSTAAKATGATWWNSTTPTSTVFSIGTDASVNASGGTYIAYLFAHDAGGFGLTGTDNVISCGSFTTDGSGNATVSLGYEPQWVMYKGASGTGGNSDWVIADIMRGYSLTGGKNLAANSSQTEGGLTGNPTATSFVVSDTINTTNIYIAIRRGPMKVPTLGTSVFSPIVSSGSEGTVLTTGFPVDLQMLADRNGYVDGVNVVDRLRGVSSTTTEVGNRLLTASTGAENSTYSPSRNWNNTGFQMPSTWAGGLNVFLNFRRAPGFFDEVCYTGTGVARTVTHNLAAVPELMIVKQRDIGGYWMVYPVPLGNKYLVLQLTDAVANGFTGLWNNTAPTSSVFSLGTGSDCNQSGGTYVAYLFATCAGVSKVFSYTGNGSSQTINCGFTAGSRFVLIKRTDAAGDWYVWDSARGIVAGNDPHLSLNTTAAEVTTDDSVDTDNTGFIVNQVAATNVNVSSATYIGLAIA